MPRMKRAIYVIFLGGSIALAASCGGQAIESSDGGPSTGSSSGSTGSSSGASLPATGSPECDRSDGICVLCSDHYWHCANSSYPPCPLGVDAGASCNGVLSTQEMACITCDDAGTGTRWQCIPTMPNEYWQPNATTCN